MLNKLSQWATIGSFFLGLYLVLRHSQPSAVTGKDMVVQPISSFPVSVWIFFGGLVLAAVLHFSAAIIQHRTPRSQLVPASTSGFDLSAVTVPDAQREGRTFLDPDITAAFLGNFFSTNTHIQAKKMVEVYKGKWMTISGSIGNIREVGDSRVSVSLEHTVFTDPLIMMFFDKQWLDRLSVLRTGNHINAIGIINDIDGSSLLLENCELVD